jgi:hypothetical protein
MGRVGLEFRARRFRELLGHREVEIVAEDSIVVWPRLPFIRFPKGKHVNPRLAFNIGFIVRHVRSLPLVTIKIVGMAVVVRQFEVAHSETDGSY